MNNRLETGVVQEGDDWPGLFIRGDNAGYFAMHLEAILAGQTDVITVSACKNLKSLLLSAVNAPRPNPQAIKLVDADNNGWNFDMDEAPRDGTEVDLWDGHRRLTNCVFINEPSMFRGWFRGWKYDDDEFFSDLDIRAFRYITLPTKEQ